MDYLISNKKHKWVHGFIIVTSNGTEIIPFEPITKPTPTIQPVTRPEENDPFNVPAPKVNPTPKGFF